MKGSQTQGGLRHSGGLRGAIVVIVSCFALSSCFLTTYAIPIGDPRPHRAPRAEYPLTVGVHLGPKFRSAIHRSVCTIDAVPPVDFVWEFDVGTPSRAIFEYALNELFGTVIVLETWPPDERKWRIDAAIKLTIESIAMPGPPPLQVAHAQTRCQEFSSDPILTYGIAFQAFPDVPPATWMVSGTYPLDYETMTLDVVGLAVNKAMRDAAAKFIVGLRDRPDFARLRAARGLNGGRRSRRLR